RQLAASDIFGRKKSRADQQDSDASAIEVALDVVVPVISEADVLIRANRYLLLRNKRLEKLLQTVQPAFALVGAFIVLMRIADEYWTGNVWRWHEFLVRCY